MDNTVENSLQTVESGGMPQLDFANWGNQAFWLVVMMVITFFVVSRIVMPRIAGVLAERQGTITNDITVAEELKQRADEASEAHARALADARAEAGRIIAEAKAEIAEELQAAQAKADAEIAARAAESETAIGEIRAGAVKSVKAVAEDVAKELLVSFGVEADAKAVKSAVAERMKG